MLVVTRIEAQKNRKDRFNIYLDGEFAFGVDAGNLLKFGLGAGEELSLEQVEEIRREADFFKLYERALHFLSFRPRSEREIRDYLRRKRICRSAGGGEGPTSLTPAGAGQAGQGRTSRPDLISNRPAERVIAKLREAGYLNDLEFARWLVKQRRESSKPRGEWRIRQELAAKGVVREVTDQVLEELVGEENELELALKAARKKWKVYDLNTPEGKKKMQGYLVRQGFGWDVVREVLRVGPLF